MSNTKKFVAVVASFAFAFAFAMTAAAVGASEIYTPATGYLQVGSGYGAKSYQNANVKAAQIALNACVSGSNLVIDGKFGPQTAMQFKSFQTMKGIKIDGIIGSQTAAALAACSGSQPTPSNPTPSNGGLSGGAGDVNITPTSTDVEDSVKEGEEKVPVLGFEVEADGSDVALTAVKVSFKNTGYASSSERLERYLDSVSILMGDEEVGSVDAEDFNRETGSPDEYSATISLDDASVDEDDEVKFYVAVSAASTIDTDDITNGVWDLQIDTVRFNDATGAILSADDVDDFQYADNDSFTFEDSSADDDLTVKSSSANPDDATVKVDENTTSDDVLLLAYKLDVDEDSSDVTIFDLPVDITVADFGSATDIDDIIDSLWVEVGGDSFDADVNAGTLGSDPDTVVYNLDLDDGDLVIDSGDTVEVKVYAKFKAQDDNYALNTTVVASLDASDIQAEGEEDDIAGSSITGDRTGGTLTLNTAVATVTAIDWDVSATGSIIDFLFTVEAEDDDVDVELADITAVDSTSGTATVGTVTVTKISGDATGSVDDYVVAEGDTARFRVRYPLTGSNGEYKNVTITSIVGQEVADDDQVSPTAVLNVN